VTDLGVLAVGRPDPVSDCCRPIAPVIAGKILLQVSAGDIGQVTDL
jgi:hypothetical protein